MARVNAFVVPICSPFTEWFEARRHERLSWFSGGVFRRAPRHGERSWPSMTRAEVDAAAGTFLAVAGPPRVNGPCGHARTGWLPLRRRVEGHAGSIQAASS